MQGATAQQIQAALQQARALHGQRQWAAAAAAYARVLAAAPAHVPALTGLGLLHAAQGERAAAAAVLEQACALAPAAAALRSQFGGLRLAWGDAAAALELFAAALALAPAQGALHHNHAQALAALGRMDEAVSGWRQAVQLAPALAPAHARLAQALLARGEPAAALPHFAEAARLGAADDLLRLDHGAALAATGNAAQALALFAGIAPASPDYAAAQNNLGNALMTLERFQEAVAAYRAALRAAPDFALAHGNLGLALLELGHPDDALAPFARAVALAPEVAAFHNGQAKARLLLGDEPGARQDFAAAILRAPEKPSQYLGLASLAGPGAEDPHFTALAAMAARAETFSPDEQMALHFALHRAYEAQGRFAAAMAHLRAGNRLRRRQIPYDEAATLARLDRLPARFEAARLASAPAGGPPDVPIFILGMPRAGSTLIEQILASHAEVHGGGEQPFLAQLATADVAMVGPAYRARLQRLAPDSPRITDKMPGNFQHIGLIRLALPHARIIHARRDPVETCLSCFAQTFTKAQPFANDLGELGRYYQAYARLMQHWRDSLPPGAMLEVDYEALVADFAPQVRRILAYCGLGWDPACLDFHRHRRIVLTASAAQVRRPLYRAPRRAAAYGAELDELRAALGLTPGLEKSR